MDSMSPPLGLGPSASFVFEFRNLLSSIRVEFPSDLDQQTLVPSITALYNRLDAQSAVVDSYLSLEGALKEKMARNDRLECELQSFQDLAPPLSEFILRRYERRQERYDDALQRTSEFEEVLGQRADQSREFQA